MSKLFAIIGATGFQGGSVLKTLYGSSEYRFRAITRDSSSDKAQALAKQYPGIELASADMDNVDSLRQAFDGADIVFGMTDFNPAIMARVLGGEVGAEYTQGKNIVDAAIAAGVKTLIYSGLDSMSEMSKGKYTHAYHFEAKNKVGEYLRRKSGVIDGFVIYLGFYMDNYTRHARISPEDGKTVEFNFPLKPTTVVPLVDTANDTGAVVKYILEHPDECHGVPQEVSGGYFEMQEMVKAFTEATGKPARYAQVPYEVVPLKEFQEMYKGQEEFGYYNGRVGFLERNKNMDYKFTTPTEFWENSKWAGPAL
ncbi:hypothetical protein H4S02_001212 [Coemansia sp. RSA 2611]|nr:hypothetical protein LPJ70_001685 [Coemansia sp. RSA 2708]KAJ2320812.1 hypothetical protein IWW52_001127 [Coemansia sp. RSA 2704]KAJ2328596.1 hypothetical protein IWW51_001106 [Coemansia sp. RSA 2702]KAJ2391651.1 hypothetical protein H4S02_001212 [Coemansia sp. RSA 2611]